MAIGNTRNISTPTVNNARSQPAGAEAPGSKRSLAAFYDEFKAQAGESKLKGAYAKKSRILFKMMKDRKRDGTGGFFHGLKTKRRAAKEKAAAEAAAATETKPVSTPTPTPTPTPTSAPVPEEKSEE